jgi:NhaA family Na+:H+ antiporter
MRFTDTFKRFVRSEQFSGVLLLGCTLVSLALANSPAAIEYQSLWHLHLGRLTLEHWINDLLMAIFFLLIGLELKRELYVGELSSLRNALLPAFAALGGMAVPALIHYGLNSGSETQAGFGIPMATDIAFALGVLALLGKRIPAALKVLVVAYAVIDDLGAIVLIAVVYTGELSAGYLGAALGLWAALLILNRHLRVMALTPYLVGGLAIWYCMLNAGIHASIAGVLLAFAIPFTARDPAAKSPSHLLENRLHAPVAYLILPLFALANTGVPIDAAALQSATSPNSMGIVFGLVLGKPLGVVLACLVAVKLRLGALSAEVRWSHVIGAGLLGGIGFTMSIFITNLAFTGQQALVDSSKLAVFAASLLAGVLGFCWLRALAPRNS